MSLCRSYFNEHLALRSPPSYLPSSDRTRLGPVRLQVRNLARSVEYYERVLGSGAWQWRVMRSAWRRKGGAAAGLAAGTAGRASGAARRAARALPLRDPGAGSRVARPVRASSQRAGRVRGQRRSRGERGAVSDRSRRARDRGLRRSPAIELADAGRGALHDDRAPGRRDLLAAAGSEPWTRMPGGIVIGHVHLHVGDLDQGAASTTRASASTKSSGVTPARSSCRPAAITITSGPTPGRPVRSATDEDARLLSWTVALPSAADVEAAAGAWSRPAIESTARTGR